MSTEIVISLLSLFGTLGGSLGGILVSSKLTNYRIEQLEKKQQEENIPMNQIIRELIKDYPEIVNLLSKPKNTD